MIDLQTIVSIAEIVSALSVALTLIVLVASIRQNTKSQRGLAVDSLAGAIATINLPAIESPVVGSAVMSATNDWGSADRDQRIIAHFFLFCIFKLSENAWYQQKAKILDRAQWEGWETVIRKYYHTKGVREVWWPSRRNAYSKQYQQFLAGTRPPDDLGSLSDIFDVETVKAE